MNHHFELAVFHTDPSLRAIHQHSESFTRSIFQIDVTVEGIIIGCHRLCGSVIVRLSYIDDAFHRLPSIGIRVESSGTNQISFFANSIAIFKWKNKITRVKSFISLIINLKMFFLLDLNGTYHPA